MSSDRVKRFLLERKNGSIKNLLGHTNRTRNEIGDSKELDVLENKIVLEHHKDTLRTYGYLSSAAAVLGTATVLTPIARSNNDRELIGSICFLCVSLAGAFAIVNNTRKYTIVKNLEGKINSYRVSKGLKPIDSRKEVKEKNNAIKQLNRFRRPGLNSYFVPKNY